MIPNANIYVVFVTRISNDPIYSRGPSSLVLFNTFLLNLSYILKCTCWVICTFFFVLRFYKCSMKIIRKWCQPANEMDEEGSEGWGFLDQRFSEGSDCWVRQFVWWVYLLSMTLNSGICDVTLEKNRSNVKSACGTLVGRTTWRLIEEHIPMKSPTSARYAYMLR